MIYICFIFAVVSSFGLVYSIIESDGEAAVAALSSLTLFFSVAGIIDMATPEKPKEYSSSEYTLEYKVTTIGEQSDTTYVLTKIEENDNR